MDKLLNEFTVNRPIGETWTVLTDVERIAPCMPGATLEEIEGDVFRGVVKVKLGAISTAFKGQANFVERDDDAHRVVLKGEGHLPFVLWDIPIFERVLRHQTPCGGV